MEDLDWGETGVPLIDELAEERGAIRFSCSETVWNDIIKSTADGKLSISVLDSEPTISLSDYTLPLTAAAPDKSAADHFAARLVDNAVRLVAPITQSLFVKPGTLPQHHARTINPAVLVGPSTEVDTPTTIATAKTSAPKKKKQRVVSKATVSSSSSSSSSSDEGSSDKPLKKRKITKPKTALGRIVADELDERAPTPGSSPRIGTAPATASSKGGTANHKRSASVSSTVSLPPLSTKSSKAVARTASVKRKRSNSDGEYTVTAASALEEAGARKEDPAKASFAGHRRTASAAATTLSGAGGGSKLRKSTSSSSSSASAANAVAPATKAQAPTTTTKSNKRRRKREERWYSSSDDSDANDSPPLDAATTDPAASASRRSAAETKKQPAIVIEDRAAYEHYKDQFEKSYPSYARLHDLLTKQRAAIEAATTNNAHEAVTNGKINDNGKGGNGNGDASHGELIKTRSTTYAIDELERLVRRLCKEREALHAIKEAMERYKGRRDRAATS